MKQNVLRLFLLAALAADGRTGGLVRKAAKPGGAAEHQPKDSRVFFSEDRMDQPCAWLQ
jgi:hypothetical protein